MQLEAGEALAAGFVLVGMVSRGEHMVIMEKETDAKPQTGRVEGVTKRMEGKTITDPQSR